MVIMNEIKERSGNTSDTSKKMCPRAARENAKKPDIHSLKTAHSGLYFHFERKNLVTSESRFNSTSKTEKVTRHRHQESSSEKQTSAESSSAADAKKILSVMDTLKISRNEGFSGREKSPLRKEIPMSPVVERLTAKKGCTRKGCGCSKTPKEDKSENKPLKTAKEQGQPPKTSNKGKSSTKAANKVPKAPPSPLPAKKTCSKLAKVLVESQEKTAKPKSILVHNEKPALKDGEKSDVSKTSEVPQSPKPPKKQCSKLAKLLAEPQEKTINAKSNLVHTEKSHFRASETNEVTRISEKTVSATSVKSVAVKTHSEIEKKVEFAWPGSGHMEAMTTSSEVPHAHVEGNPEILNGPELVATLDTRACLLNGSDHHEHLCDPHLGLESPGGTRRELLSKIPRKAHGATGMKSEGSFNKEMMSEQLIAL